MTIPKPDSDGEKFTLNNIAGAIVVQGGGELYMLDTVEGTSPPWPWIGTTTSKFGTSTMTGADFVVDNGGSITIRAPGGKVSMALSGSATVLGVNTSTTATVSRHEVLITSMFSVNPNATLTVGQAGESGQKTVLTIGEGGVFINNGTVRLNPNSIIHAPKNTSLGSVMDYASKVITPNEIDDPDDSNKKIWEWKGKTTTST